MCAFSKFFKQGCINFVLIPLIILKVDSVFQPTVTFELIQHIRSISVEQIKSSLSCICLDMDTLQVGIKAGGEQMGIIREQMKILLSKTYAVCSCGTDQLTNYE